uniref:Death domain-containing protein n=2 Tax=Amphimedon queenslandica TaxID=400682 RepID=A0A1X7VB73_AMPQE
HWESIKKESISGEGLWTKERYTHASAIINGDSTSPALVVIGGRDNNNQLVNECLLFDNITTGQFSCKKIPLPESVTGRYNHSLTAVTMSPHCVWLVIVGGREKFRLKDVGGGVKEPMHTFIIDTNRRIMIIELVYIEAGEWIVQSVLDANDLTSKKYQEKYSSYSKTRTWWMDQLIEYPTEKEMKLQRYIQSLHQELQVADQNKVSLQEALTEANKQAKVDDSETVKSEKLEEVLKAQAQLQEEKQIITDESINVEDNEKLKAKLDDYEVYITEIEEEKKQVEEEKDKVEEQYLKEKEITKELKSKVADNELYTAKLMKEREQWSQIKETSTIGLQFNYLEKEQEEKCISLKKLHKGSATTLVANNLTEISFYGALYCKKTRGKYYWDYSYLVYQSFPTNITNKILADYKTYWTCVTEETDVIFEDNSTAITLNLPSNQNWDIMGKTSPLIYYKDYIKRNRIQSNMQFMLLWKGQGHPTIEPVVLHLSGTVQPNTVLIVTNLIEDEDRNHVHVVHTEKQLDTTNLNQIILALKDSKYEVGTWHRLCLSLGLLEGTLKAIKSDENDSEDCLRTCLNKWLQRADGVDAPTWTSLEKALNNIGQKAVAESLKNN